MFERRSLSTPRHKNLQELFSKIIAMRFLMGIRRKMIIAFYRARHQLFDGSLKVPNCNNRFKTDWHPCREGVLLRIHALSLHYEADGAGMCYLPRMRRNSKPITTSPEIVTNIAELTKMNFNMLVKLVPWMDANEKSQRKFRYAVINSLSRIEATVSLLLVDQLARTQKPQWYDSDKLDESAKAAEEFIKKQSLEKGSVAVKYIYTETPPAAASHDRRKKWTDWEI